jgi:hypothetical protein
MSWRNQELNAAPWLRLVYRGRRIRDEETPGSLGLQNETMVHVVVSHVRPATPTTLAIPSDHDVL